MDKKEYILNQLRKTYFKKYENYCVTRIYTLVNNLNLQMVTQQLFKRGNNKIVLADIYFPQINLWVEIDEQHHDFQEKADKIRTQEVLINNKINRLEEVVQITGLEEPYRIKVAFGYSIEDINNQIDKIVEEINRRIDALGNKLQWDCKDKEPSEFIGKIIRYSDNVKFRTIEKVTKLFKTVRYRQQCAWFKLKENEYLWCPKLDLIENEHKACKWENKISSDGTKIYESLRYEIEGDEDLLNWNEKRITFAYYNDENGSRMYKYRGVFALDKEGTQNYNYKKRVWKKISDELDLSQYE
ncbi:hypothetical protein IJX73_00105 [bacterium]|nr:hypothetical protein [bacterium]MBQ9149312.1 hypothetical protein [bacterium]